MNLRTLFITRLAPAVLAGISLACPAAAAPADPPTPPPAPVHAGQRPGEVLGPEEYEQFRRRLNEAKTPQERDAVRTDLRAAVAHAKDQEAHAKDQEAHARDQGAQPPAERLLTQDERDRFRGRMEEARTPEDRAAVRQDLRDTILQRRRAAQQDRAVPAPNPH